MSRLFARAVEVNRDLLERDEGAAGVFLNKVKHGGDRLQQPGLARTFERIAGLGRDGFYTGPVAEDIVKTLTALDSAMSLEDLASFKPEWVTPIRSIYRDVELLEMPPNTQGPAAILLANIVEDWPVQEMGHTTA